MNIHILAAFLASSGIIITIAAKRIAKKREEEEIARGIKISIFEGKAGRIEEAFTKALKENSMDNSLARVFVLPFKDESCVIMVSHDGGPAILEVSMGVDDEGLITIMEHDRALNTSKTRCSGDDYASITALIKAECEFLQALAGESAAV